MKVISSEENELKFDNGLVITGDHSQSCCEYNYLDFEQLPVGTRLDDHSAASFVSAITIKDDGFIVRDVAGMPLWVQARSRQNGYYSHGVNMIVNDGEMALSPKKPGHTSSYDNLFEGEEVTY